MFQDFIKRHGVINSVLVVVCLALIWRAIWHGADYFFGNSFLGDILPGVVALAYLYFNDLSLKELKQDVH
jgi:hypothetical protein